MFLSIFKTTLVTLVFQLLAAAQAVAFGHSITTTRSNDSYTLTCIPKISSDNEISNSFLATVSDRSGREVAKLAGPLYCNHYHMFEVRGKSLFWIERNGNPDKTKDWTDELWVMDIEKKDRRKLTSQKGLDFRASPDGRFVVIEKDEELYWVDVERKEVKKIVSKTDGGDDEGFTLLEWSSDGQKFWFGKGVVEGWSKTGLYAGGKIFWYPVAGGFRQEEMLEPNFGWYITSSTPSFIDADSRAEYMAKNKSVSLMATDIVSGQQVEIAKIVKGDFDPRLEGPDQLTYVVSGNRKKISFKEIKEKFDTKAANRNH